MVKDLKLRQAGGSVSATLPKDMADRLHLAAGDHVLAVETNDGILLTPYDPRPSGRSPSRPRWRRSTGTPAK